MHIVCHNGSDVRLASPKELVPTIPIILVSQVLAVLVISHDIIAQLVDQIFCLI
jgi:hypothetical protein